MSGVVLAELIEAAHEFGDLVVADLPLSCHDLAYSGGDEAAPQAGPISTHFALANSAPAGGEDDKFGAR